MSEKQSSEGDPRSEAAPTEPDPMLAIKAKPIVADVSSPAQTLALTPDLAQPPWVSSTPAPSLNAGPDLQSSVFGFSPAVLLAGAALQNVSELGPNARDDGSPDKFRLTTLIKALPEPAPTMLEKLAQVRLDPVPTEAMHLKPPMTEHLSPVPSATNPQTAETPALSPAPVSVTTTPLPSPAAKSQIRTITARLGSAIKTTLKFIAIAFATWFVTVLVLIAVFRFVDPPQSMLMLTKRLSGETLQHEWVPLDKVALNLRRAVITSEDAKFCRHWGFDLGEIRSALRSTEGYGRGASTITQQLAKNLFLWPGKSYVRKGLEVPLTLALEGLWPKRRILEVYLNFAEWGPGVFGAEAASQYYYNKPVAEVSERESALLAISLPNPIARDASDPGPKVVRRAATLQNRMRVQGVSYCALSGLPRRTPVAKPAER